MADILLSKPAANAARVVPSAPDTRFVFDFPANAATLSRAGDNLLLTFDDGSSIELTNFYTQYSQEAMPEFVIDGTLVAGADFFNAFGPDLMPAAGPAAGAATRAARYNEFGDSSLMDGINHLDGLDTGFDGAAVTTLDESAVPVPDALSGDGAAGDVVDHGVTIRPVDSDVVAGSDILRVQEGALLEKADTPAIAENTTAIANGAMIIDAPDGVAGIIIGGVTVFQNGVLTGAPVPTDEGRLDVTGFDPASGRLEYAYTLERSTQEHTEPGADDISHDLSVVVTDTDGDVGSATITVVITDDVPTISVDAGSKDVASGFEVTGRVEIDYGADDGAGKSLTVNGKDGQTSDDGKLSFSLENGTLVFDPSTGDYTFRAEANVDGSQDLKFTVTDADGDTAATTVRVDITKPDEPEFTGEVTVDEKGLGDTADTSETVTWKAPDGYTVVGIESNGKLGTTEIVNGEVQYTLTSAITHETVQGANTDDNADSFTVTIKDAQGNTYDVTVNVDVVDDVPTISAADVSTSLTPGDSGKNLQDVDQNISFTEGDPSQPVQTSWWDGQVNISAVKVSYETDAQGKVIYDPDGKPTINDIDGNSNYTLGYSSYKGNGQENDYGLTVKGDYHEWEIGVSSDGTPSEGVVIDLGGKLAYGMTINFGAFYSGEPGAQGQTQWDHVSEKALVNFYRGGELVASVLVEGNSATGEFTLETSDVVAQGFDKVVISSVDNKTSNFPNEDSDFVIQGIDFITKPDNPLIVTTGTVRGESGADGFADGYENAVFDHATNESYTVVIDGKEYTATLDVTTGSTGDSILTATLDGDKEGDVLFSATLDKDGNWTMEQYEQFQVKTDGADTSNIFELKFETRDSDGDIASTSAKVPLEVVEQTTTESGDSISNSDDVINIAGGDGVAGTLVAGDTGGVTEGQQVGSNYNVCFVLDTSGSMDGAVSRYETRLDVATQSIENFIKNSIHEGDFVGTVNLAVVPFASEAGSVIKVSITKTAQGERYTFGEEVYDNYADFSKAFETSLGNLNANGGTNYEAGFSNAADWFNGLEGTSNATGNITYFLSDGVPTYHGTSSYGGGNYATLDDVKGAWDGYQELLGSAANMQVNAIGFGKDLDDEAMKTLAMLDNTSTEVDGVHGNQAADGSLYYSERQWGGLSSKEWQPTPAVPGGNATQVTDANGLEAAFESGFTPPALSDAGSDTITAERSASSGIIYGDVLNTDELLRGLHTTLGESDLASTLPAYGSGSAVFDWLEKNAEADALANTAYEDWSQDKTKEYILQHHTELGYETRVGADGNFYLVDLDGNVWNLDGTEANVRLDDLTGRAGGDDAITGSAHNDVIFGQEGNDVIHGGAGHDILHGGTGDDLLFGDGDTLNNANLLDDLATYLEMSSDDPAGIMSKIRGLDAPSLEGLAKKVEEFESPADGNDQLYGGEGDDILFGMGGNDQLFGGSGDDYLFGGGGDDYLDGGSGEDKLYGGSGSDILVYDSNDYLVDGGEGIDFLVGNGATAPILHNNGQQYVENIEVFIDTGMDLQSMEDLKDQLGIAVEDGKVTGLDADSGWNRSTTVTAPDGYAAYEHSGSGGSVDATILVATKVMESDNG
ncbi:hypothetical protein HMPREF1022_00603 [Desulfovibrio sp. 6_1_46AFAA]|uniref:VWA domain-containing protein n=1 Tax=Desulfovibrio sp. 6_1_46AFAA TaxID=665942 RepID=UPI0002236C59|nr:VWA domain-containing protein [Desulfovibrio sp. 6_1_46AFAA]EGW52476.1 hypothetical protein HMPREF1022_00603 [Desulfovibrio sp. 6_1_46AFAA]